MRTYFFTEGPLSTVPGERGSFGVSSTVSEEILRVTRVREKRKIFSLGT
jgi:hypothetical protein